MKSHSSDPVSQAKAERDIDAVVKFMGENANLKFEKWPEKMKKVVARVGRWYDKKEKKSSCRFK